MNDDNLQQINQGQIKSKIQAVAKWSRSPQATKTRKFMAIALNRKNWQRIKNIRSKIKALAEWSREPESAWTSLTCAIAVCLYFISPEDFIPDFLLFVGLIDDFIVIIGTIIFLAFYLKENIVKLAEQEVKKYIFRLKISLIFGIATVSSLISTKLLIKYGNLFRFNWLLKTA
ncbi:MAG: DUF1232 domain-containing protein [Spirirestis rafaelensis WJT71-NPBG6]|jgi:uncharacterized membrane protein YkvA (DUF1232 family)|nr:DUF1232 domain-containing protein [Spirirestis rafaelensis WJT71-NPBG6]